jgi:hypothetical protein
MLIPPVCSIVPEPVFLQPGFLSFSNTGMMEDERKIERTEHLTQLVDPSPFIAG